MIATSIYIPRISRHYNAQSIERHMKEHGIGIVSYVDFTPINKKPGFDEKVDADIRSAFVHFENPCESLFYMGNHVFWETIATGQPYKLQVSRHEYWICLKNKNPIQRTMMNIHQVVENGRHLEGLVEAQAKTIQEQAERIEVLERKLEGTHNVVYQLIGGLFHQRDQDDILSTYLDNLFCRKIGQYSGNLSKWGIWPTTRQGDECEKKIADLEEKFTNLENDLTDYRVL